MSVVTFNTFVDLTVDSAMADLQAVLSRRPDVVGLQEVFAAKRKAAVLERYACEACAYATFMPSGGRGATPILYRRDRFRLLSARTVEVAPTTYVGREGAGPPTIQAKYVNALVLFDRRSKRTYSFLNSHFVPTVQAEGGGPNGNQARQAMYREHMAGLLGVVADLKDDGPCFVLGDFNVDWRRDERARYESFPFASLTGRGFEANWGELGMPTQGTFDHSSVLLDTVWERGLGVRPVEEAVLRGLHSDHNAVTVTYRVRARD